MRSGEVEPNLVQMNESFNLPYLDELIARKREGTERQTIDDTDIVLFETEYQRLRELLVFESERTSLPAEATSRAGLHDLLLRLRRV